jgi:hypothetical protein
VGAAGASGAGQGDKRPAEDAREYARRLRSPPIDQVLGDVVVGLLHAAQAKLGRRDARLPTGVTAVAHEHAPLPAGRTHQADRPGAGATAAGSGERGKPREPAGPAGGQRSGPGPGPAAGPVQRSAWRDHQGCGRTPGSSSHSFPTSPRGANALSRACNRHRVPGV